MSEVEPNIEEDVLETIKEVWAEFPELRLTQLIVNAVAPVKPEYIFNIEDSKLIESLKNFKNKNGSSGKV